jgi:hypothetical protein
VRVVYKQAQHTASACGDATLAGATEWPARSAVEACGDAAPVAGTVKSASNGSTPDALLCRRAATISTATPSTHELLYH